MYDNKVRLSKDVIDKATEIAKEWGLKNARAAIEAVFRKYADEYRYGRREERAIEEINRERSASSEVTEVLLAGLGDK